MTAAPALPAIRVVRIEDLFRVAATRRATDVEWTPETALVDVLPLEARTASADWVVSVDGRRVPPEGRGRTPLRPGAQVLVYRRLSAVGALIGPAIQVAAVAYTLWKTADAMRRAKIQQAHAQQRAAARADRMGDTMTYGWDGIRNSITAGRQIPCLYGEHRIGGHYVYGEVRRGIANVLDATLVVSEGECEGLQAGTIEVNGAPSSEYRGVTFASANGADSQAALALWPSTIPRTRTNPGNVLDSTGVGVVTYRSQTNRTGFRITIQLPDGLRLLRFGIVYRGQASVNITLQYRHRSWPSGSFGPSVQFSTGWLVYKRIQTFIPTLTGFGQHSVSTRTAQLLSDQYELEFKVASISITNPFGYTLTWDTTARIVLRQVDEFNEIQQTYPGLALLGITALGTQKLGGSLPTVTSVWEGRKVRVYSALTNPIVSRATGVTNAGTARFTDAGANFTTAGVVAGDVLIIPSGTDSGTYRIYERTSATEVRVTTLAGAAVSFTGATGITYTIESELGFSYTTVYTQNPAWIVLDILANERFGGGSHLRYDRHFDLAAFISAATFCDRLVNRGVANPVKSGTNGATTGGTNEITVDAGFNLLDGTVAVGDRFTVESGSDAGDYLLSSITNAITVRVTTLAGAIPSFAGGPVFNWHLDGVEKFALCDHYFDGSTTVWDAALAVAGNARCAIVRTGGKIKLIPDQSGSAVQAFSMGNIIPETYRHTYLAREEAATRVEVQFLDQAKNYKRQTAEMEATDATTVTDKPVKTVIDLFGVTRKSQAMRMAKWVWLQNKEEREVIEFEASVDAIALEWGDVFRFQHDAVELGEVDEVMPGGRLADGSTTTLAVLDHAILVTANNTHLTVRRNSDGALGTATVTAPAAGTRTHRLTVATLPWTPSAGDVWLLSPNTSPLVTEWKVTSITRGGTLRRKIRAVRYVSSLYTDADDCGVLPAT